MIFVIGKIQKNVFSFKKCNIDRKALRGNVFITDRHRHPWENYLFFKYRTVILSLILVS